MPNIHPIDYRYGSDEVRRIFSRESWLEYFKLVEKNLLKALAEAEIINLNINEERLEKCFRKVDLDRVNYWEKKIKHETMAVVKALSEACEEYGKYIHLGATSNDILDCILALQIRDTTRIIIRKTRKLLQELIDFVEEYKEVPLLGRTHGRAALPTTYGFRFALFLDELYRAYKDIKYTYELAAVGKLGGAIGTQVELYPEMEKVEEKLLSKLGINKAIYYTQIVPRDRLAHYLTSLIILSSILEHIANEIRIMQRSGIQELVEEFGEQQVGSSIMPHKKNPILSERVCGLGRKIRALASAVCENIILEDERDLRNSSFERTTIPEIILLVDEQLSLVERIIANLKINKEEALNNLIREEPHIYSDLILQYITVRGGDRQITHEKLRKIFTSGEKLDKEKLIKEIMRNNYLSKYIDEDTLREALNLKIYIEASVKRVNKLINYIKTRLSQESQQSS